MATLYLYRVTKVIRVVDGDTVDCRIDLGFGVAIDERFRLLGVDAAEIVGSEREPALRAKAWLEARLGQAPDTLHVESQKHDSFRRWLGRFFDRAGDVAEDMIEAGMAKPYQRGV